MITRITPSKITAEHDSIEFSVECEAFQPGHGSPNLVIFQNSIMRTNANKEELPLTQQTKDTLLEVLKSDLDHKNISYDIE